MEVTQGRGRRRLPGRSGGLSRTLKIRRGWSAVLEEGPVNGLESYVGIDDVFCAWMHGWMER